MRKAAVAVIVGLALILAAGLALRTLLTDPQPAGQGAGRTPGGNASPTATPSTATPSTATPTSTVTPSTLPTPIPTPTEQASPVLSGSATTEGSQPSFFTRPTPLGPTRPPAVVHHRPTDLRLSNTAVAENRPVGARVGTFSVRDRDRGDRVVFRLVPGRGGSGNGSFRIVGRTLRTAAVFDYETQRSYSIRVRATDGRGLGRTRVFAIRVTDVVENRAPTDLALSAVTLAENQAAGTTVGTLSTTDPDAGDTHTYRLVPGAGSDDNASFAISGSTLKTAAVLDFEGTGPTYTVRVETADGHGRTFAKALTITTTDTNDAPTDLSLAPGMVAENAPAGTTVGTLSATDQDAGASATFTLVAGAGDGDNASFTIAGDQLKTAAVLDFEAKASYSVRVQADDGNGGTFSKQLTVAVTDVNEAPTDLTLAPDTVAERQPVGTTVGTLSATDQDTGSAATFTLVAGTGDDDNASFQVAGSSLTTAMILDFETKATYSVRVQADDGHGGTFAKALTVHVTDVNDPPTDLTLAPDTIAENAAVGTAVGTLSASDQDAGATASFALAPGSGDADNGSFAIAGDQLLTAAVLDFETKATYTVRVQADDGRGGTFARQLTVQVTDVNEAPTDILLTPSTVAENVPGGTTVGALSATDQDTGATAAFTLVMGVGDADNAFFEIAGSTLTTAAAAVFDFETKASYSVRVQADDGQGGTFARALTVTVTDVNEAPTDITLTPSTVAESSPVGTVVGTLSADDPDAGTTAAFTLVTGAGDGDNAAFTIAGDQLLTTAAFDFETKASYTVRVQADDGQGGTFARQLTISVTDVNEAPTDLTLAPDTVAENQPAGTTVGTLSAVDPDTGATATFTLVTGSGDGDNASFTITGDQLLTAAVLDFETKATYSVRVQADDGQGGTFAKQLTITVTDANDPPTDIALDNDSINENQPAGLAVGTLSATDEPGDTAGFSLVSGAGDTGNAAFQVAGTTLQTAAPLNFETNPSYSIRLRVTDAAGGSFDEVFTITVTDVNDPPTVVNDSYSGAVGNTRTVLGTVAPGPVVTLSGNVVTANDTDEDVGQTLSAVAETLTTTGGGTVTVNANGSFDYLPGVGDKSQTDTFAYRVTDGTATVAGSATVAIGNALVWYVDSSSPAPTPDGRSNAPLPTLAPLQGAGDPDGSADILFVYQGSGTYTGGMVLEPSQRLLGQPFGLTVLGHTIVAPGGANPVVTNGAGAGITVASDAEVQAVNVTGSSAAGITGTSVTNATIGSNVTISGSTGPELALSGGSGTVTSGATITNTSGSSVSIQSRSGGAVTQSGPVNDNGGSGIALASNTGATISFTGGLALSTGANPAFTATGGGTVNATGTNTAATTTGTAVTVTNTTIGASGLTFRSVAANGGLNGIKLDTTGSGGGLRVTGTGTAGSGGTIQNTTADAISLSGTRGVSLARMSILNNLGSGINGAAVTNFDLASSTVDNNGDDAAADEAGIRFTNLAGTASITDTTVAHSIEDNARILNDSGTLSQLTVSGSTFRDTETVSPGNVGLLIQANNTAAITADVITSSFLRNRADGLAVITNNSGTVDIEAGAAGVPGSGGTYQDNNIGVNIAHNSSGSLTFDVRNGSFSAPTLAGAASPINLNKATLGSGTMSGTVVGNSISNANSATGPGIRVIGNGPTGTMTVRLDSNNVSQVGNFGIQVLARDTTGGLGNTLNVTATNNTVNLTSPLSAEAIRIDAASTATDTPRMCADVRANSATTAGAGLSGIRVRQRFGSFFTLEGYAGSATDDAAVRTFLSANNNGATTAADHTASGSAGFLTTASCPEP